MGLSDPVIHALRTAQSRRWLRPRWTSSSTGCCVALSPAAEAPGADVWNHPRREEVAASISMWPGLSREGCGRLATVGCVTPRLTRADRLPSACSRLPLAVDPWDADGPPSLDAYRRGAAGEMRAHDLGTTLPCAIDGHDVYVPGGMGNLLAVAAAAAPSKTRRARPDHHLYLAVYRPRGFRRRRRADPPTHGTRNGHPARTAGWQATTRCGISGDPSVFNT